MIDVVSTCSSSCHVHVHVLVHVFHPALEEREHVTCERSEAQ